MGPEPGPQAAEAGSSQQADSTGGAGGSGRGSVAGVAQRGRSRSLRIGGARGGLAGRGATEHSAGGRGMGWGRTGSQGLELVAAIGSGVTTEPEARTSPLPVDGWFHGS